MNVWAEIDALQAKFDRERSETDNALTALRAIRGSLGFDEYGRWVCRYIPKGQRTQEHLTAASGPALVEKLKAIRELEAPRK